jgi:competence protein ComEA
MDPFAGDPLPAGWRVVEPMAADRPPKPDERAGTKRTEVTAAVAILVAVLAGALLLLGPGVVPSVVPGGAEAASADVRDGSNGTGRPDGASIRPSPALTELVVDVSGAVRRPGLYRLSPGSRVGDAIAAAGGFGPRVDAAAVAASINLAERLEDGSKVLVPERGSAVAASAGPGTGNGTVGSTGGSAGTPTPSTLGGPARIDLNSATQAELDTLPGIGPVTARKILDSRASAPFQQPDDLVSRGLVRAGVYDGIRDLVVVRP